MLRRAGAVAAAVTLGLPLVGCSGGSSAPQAQPQPGPRTFSEAACPTTSTPPMRWPAQVPADFPKPEHAVLDTAGTTTTADGVQITRFSTPTSLRQAVLFVVDKLPKAGYVLGRGDAEVSEADAPFVHGSTRGLVRLLAVEPCKTLWLLATVKANAPNSGSPLLPTHSPSGSPSPLPFG